MPPPGSRDASADAARVHPFGDRAWLVEPPDPAPAGWVLRAAAHARARWPDALLVPGLASLLIARSATWDGWGRGAGAESANAGAQASTGPRHYWPASAEEVSAALSEPSGEPIGPHRPARTHVIEARYEGPDLAVAAAQAGVTPTELVARHSAAVWTVAAVGFSPGFGYLTSADPIFDAITRRPDPRPRVTAGAIAVAAGMCAVYPSATPGGWQLIGTSDAALWDPLGDPPARLQVGDLVRFEAA